MWAELTRKIKTFFLGIKPAPEASVVVQTYADMRAEDTSSILLDEQHLPYSKRVLLDAFEYEIVSAEAAIVGCKAIGMQPSVTKPFEERLELLRVMQIGVFDYQTIDHEDRPHIASLDAAGGLTKLVESLEDDTLPREEIAIWNGLLRTGLALVVKYNKRSLAEIDQYVAKVDNPREAL